MPLNIASLRLRRAGVVRAALVAITFDTSDSVAGYRPKALTTAYETTGYDTLRNTTFLTIVRTRCEETAGGAALRRCGYIAHSQGVWSRPERVAALTVQRRHLPCVFSMGGLAKWGGDRVPYRTRGEDSFTLSQPWI